MKKIKITIYSFFISITIFIFTFFTYSCSASSSIYFGNFESYMSSDVKKELSRDYNVNFQTYKTNEQFIREFDQNYDVAISSSYAVIELIEKNKLEKLDWSKFNIPDIKTATAALNLFTKPIQDIATGYDLDGDGTFYPEDPDDNILNYAIPYFFQDFIVGYKREKLTLPIEGSSLYPKTWRDFFEYIKTQNIERSIAVDDPRTIFSLGRLIQGVNENVNPDSSFSNIDNFQEVYNFLPNYFNGKNKIIFNSDSGNVLNDLANPKGSDMGIMYNGDVLYSMQGGDEGHETEIDFFRPESGSNLALDLLVIKNNINNNKKNSIYEIIKKLLLADGIAPMVPISPDSLTYLNFDFVQYTSPLKSLYDHVLDREGYFQGHPKQASLIKVFQIPDIKEPPDIILKRIEEKINSIQKSNMQIAYLKTKSKL